MNIENLKKFIKKKLKKFSLIQNINLNMNQQQKSILISYINSNFYNDIINKPVYHTNIYEINQIVKVFIDKGYVIDIVNCLDTNSIELIKHKKYDIVFGFGDVFYEICKLNPEAKKIIYITENHPRISYKQEMKRIEYYKERHGKKIKLKRSGIYFKEEHFQNVDYAIILGDLENFCGYSFKKYSLFPTGFINPNYKYTDRNLVDTNRNFLWFGSTGAIHKGLDLLIDVFKNYPNLTLHVCGLNPKERKYLDLSYDNIIDHGKVDVRSTKFLELANSCSFIILPSCSEALSTSVLTGMLHSMIPVVIKNTGFNRISGYAIFLDDYKIDYLEQNILKLAYNYSDEQIEMHRRIYHFAHKNFTLKVFTESFKNIIDLIETE